MICVQRQPGRTDRLDPPDYTPHASEGTAMASSFPGLATTGLELPDGFFPSDYQRSSPWRNLVSNAATLDDGLGEAIAGHKRLRSEDGGGATSWAPPSTRSVEIVDRPMSWPAPLGEILMKAAERSSPGYNSSPSYTRSCSSDSGIVHSEFCCKPYFSPPRNHGNVRFPSP